MASHSFLALLLVIAVVSAQASEIKKKKKICEGDSFTLSCPSGTVIKMSKAEYGRKSKSGCQANYDRRDPELNPSSACLVDVKDVMSQDCDNKRSCMVSATNAALTNPCSGEPVNIYKMLKVNYKCIEDKSAVPAKMTKAVCEHHKAAITCPPGKQINIKAANYGRTDTSTCLRQPNPSIKTDCIRDVSARVKAFCQGRESCEIVSTNNVYGDPCWGTYKYLDVEYKCQNRAPYKPEPIFMDICEWRGANIACPPGKTINLVKAVYGRTDRNVCTLNMGPHHGAVQKTDCEKDVKSMIMPNCQGKQSCHIVAKNSLYTDPCVGTFKYLEANYQCE